MSKSYIKNNKVVVPHLEFHVAHACNLKCLSCSHYSYATPQKNESLEEFKNQFNCWSKKIDPKVIRVLGGEPFLNKNLDKLLFFARKCFINSKLVLVTNGLLIKKSKIDLNFIEKNNVFLVISLHSNSAEYKSHLKENLDYLKKNNINYWTMNSMENWRLSHHVINNTITPFYDNNKRKSWEICCAKNCKQLYQNKIYKCPQTTYINIVKNYKIHNDYNVMLKYKPLEFRNDLELEEIKKFWNLEDEDICLMCPSRYTNINKGNPMKDYNKFPVFL